MEKILRIPFAEIDTADLLVDVVLDVLHTGEITEKPAIR